MLRDTGRICNWPPQIGLRARCGDSGKARAVALQGEAYSMTGRTPMTDQKAPTPGYKRSDFLRDLKKASKKLAPKPSVRSPRKPGT